MKHRALRRVLNLVAAATLASSAAAQDLPSGASKQILSRAPRLLRQTCAILIYPESAVRQDLTGTVRVRYLVGATGRVEKTEISRSSGHEILDKATSDWLQTCSFEPAIVNGESVESASEMQYVWKISD